MRESNGQPATGNGRLPFACCPLPVANLHWAAAYLGRPWRLGADGPETYDCWGLVRAVYRARCGVEIPAAGFASEEPRALIAGIAAYPAWNEWRPVEGRPDELDAVVMAQGRHPVHVGLWVAAGAAMAVLHTTRAGGVVVQDKPSLSATGFRIVGTYRHASR